MSPKRPFKIVIIGGGISGLSLANMLERFDIDYVVLEGRSEIHPPQGAAIGLMPNGSYIMDQLGIYDTIRAATTNAEIRDSHMRDSNGKSIMYLKHMLYHQEIRHGYPMLFFDRQLFLKLLYTQVKHKDRIHVNSKVDRVENFDSGARVITKDGRTYTGDIVIGADGIHSAIRKQLRKTSERFDPFEEEKVPCYYQCCFGISQDIEGWPQSEQCFTSNLGKSFLLVSGPNNRCYWFLFVKYPEPKYGKDIPRYTEEDTTKFIDKYRGLMVRDNLTFGQVVDKSVETFLSPLHEVVFKQWFSDRTLLIGDSAHKPNPIGGMGGNAAIESAAEFVNALVDTRKKRPNQSLDGLSQPEIEAIFQHVQDSRFNRAELTVASSHELQALSAMERPLFAKFAQRVLMPLAGKHNFFRELSNRVKGASNLKHLPKPSRPYVYPYDHDLPAKPLTGPFSRIMRPLFCLGFIMLVYASETRGQVATPEELVSVGSNLLSPAKATPVYYITSMLSPLLMYSAEGSRIGRQGSLIGLPLIFILDMLRRGLGRTSLSYALVYALHSPQVTVDRSIPVEVAGSLIPATIMGFILPAISLAYSQPNAGNWQRWASMLPVTFHAVLKISKLVMARVKPSTEDTDRHTEWYSTDDVRPLNLAYKLAFGIQAMAHIGAIASYTLGTGNSIAKAASGILSSPGGSGLLSFAAGSIGHSLYQIWELRKQGYVTTWSGLKAASALVLGSVVVGPGASSLAVYRWRENVISRLSSRASS
ncbi:FAD/NAD(P)-binding domain-containing protein [Xylaria intraflava]|nr:FAD/NAD(P)-binding domain-containing protein [Xylaria intraflava]